MEAQLYQMFEFDIEVTFELSGIWFENVNDNSMTHRFLQPL